VQDSRNRGGRLDFRRHLIEQVGRTLPLELILHVQHERCRYLVLEGFGLDPDGLMKNSWYRDGRRRYAASHDAYVPYPDAIRSRSPPRIATGSRWDCVRAQARELMAVSTMSHPASIAFISETRVTPVVEWACRLTKVSVPHFC